MDRVGSLALALLAATACGGRSFDDGYGVEELTGSGGAGGGASSRGGAASSQEDDRLQPFEIGRSWQYRETLFDPSAAASCTGPFTSRVSDRVMVDGQAGWNYYPTCIPGPVTMFIDGDSIDAILSGSRVRYANPPVVEGATWQGDVGIDYVWHDAGAVTVEAGSFDRCWRRAALANDDEYIILCRGAGLIVSNVPAGNFRLELAGKNF